jgi:hypothetical protein
VVELGRQGNLIGINVVFTIAEPFKGVVASKAFVI